MEYTVVTENNKGFGTLKWFGNSRYAKSPGAALLGRATALYDYKMDFHTDLELLINDFHERSRKFRSIGIWTQTDNSRIRRAWTLACYDHPGKGVDAVMDADVTLDEVQTWYDFEYEGLSDSVLIDRTMKAIWGGDFVQFSKDLLIHGRVVHLWRTWGQIPGVDVHKVLHYALDRTRRLVGDRKILDRRKEEYVEQEVLPYRAEFIKAWKKAEDVLLSVSIPKRRFITFEENDNNG